MKLKYVSFIGDSFFKKRFYLPYFAVYNVHFFAQIFEGKIRVRVIRGLYLKYLVPVLVFCNCLLT